LSTASIHQAVPQKQIIPRWTIPAKAAPIWFVPRLMSLPYEEIVDGETLLRSPPGPRHEKICERLHARMAYVLANHGAARLLSPRSVVQLSPGTMIRPDLALVTAATGKLWLAVEIINSEDHRPDTVLKKTIYEDFNVARLWMVDPRYDNVELYHGMACCLALRCILAAKGRLSETLLPGFDMTVAELFAV
jgi:Uma2 family endonuclease